NQTTGLAHYLLPGCAHAEKRGTFTNIKGRVQKFMKAVEPRGDARPEWEFLHDLVYNVTGQNGFVSIEGLFNQMTKEVPAFNGLFLTRLGFWQPIADGLKTILKEDFTPSYARKAYFWLAPAIALIPSFLTTAVIPFGSTLGNPNNKMVIADLDVGILYTFGIVSLGVYGIVLAGYAANSKYPFLGGIRSSAQMISYEIAMGMSVVPLFLIAGNLNLSRVIEYQAQNGWLIW